MNSFSGILYPHTSDWLQRGIYIQISLFLPKRTFRATSYHKKRQASKQSNAPQANPQLQITWHKCIRTINIRAIKLNKFAPRQTRIETLYSIRQSEIGTSNLYLINLYIALLAKALQKSFVRSNAKFFEIKANCIHFFSSVTKQH